MQPPGKQILLMVLYLAGFKAEMRKCWYHCVKADKTEILHIAFACCTEDRLTSSSWVDYSLGFQFQV